MVTGDSSLQGHVDYYIQDGSCSCDPHCPSFKNAPINGSYDSVTELITLEVPTDYENPESIEVDLAFELEPE
jgi:hypothetical protein